MLLRPTVLVVEHLRVGRHLLPLDEQRQQGQQYAQHAEDLQRNALDVLLDLTVQYHAQNLSGHVEEGPEHEELPAEER